MEDFFEELNNRPRPNLFKRIKLWWEFEGTYLFRNFKQGLKNIWYWLPIIWKDRNWDQNYIYEVLKHKLKAQAKYIGDTDRHTKAQLDSRRIKICVKLIQLCQDETYAMEYASYFKDKNWFEPCEDKLGYSTWKSETISENFDTFYKKYPLVYKRVIKGEGLYTLDSKDESDMKRLIAMNIAHLNQNRARKLLFKIMEENIERWWD
jgi:hypothetical protein